MTPDELADEVASTIAACRARIMGTGAEQYSAGEVQQFELMTPEAILRAAMEEAEDLVAYGVMFRIRTQRVLDALEKESADG